MPQQIVLPNDVWLFTIANVNFPHLLCKSGNRLPSGTEVTIGKPCSKTYDHSEKLVVPVDWGTKEHFIILSELGNLNSCGKK